MSNGNGDGEHQCYWSWGELIKHLYHHLEVAIWHDPLQEGVDIKCVDCDTWLFRHESPPTPEALRDYVRSGGTHCPFCASPKIGAIGTHHDRGRAVRIAYCQDCDKLWHEVYALIGYEEKG
jgi:hypothetical protein